MQDEAYRIERMKHLLELSRRVDLTDLDRAGLFGAVWALADALLARVEVAERIDRAYAREKLRGWRDHLATALGYGDAMGHSTTQHWSWAAGELDSFSGTVLR